MKEKNELTAMKPRKKERGFNSLRREQNIFYWIMIVLPLIQFVMFYIYVNLDSFLLAFEEYNPISNKFDFVYFKNFQYIFEDFSRPTGAIRKAFNNSLLAFGLGLLMQPLNLLIPYYVTKKGVGSEFFKVLLFLPSILSSMVLGLLYKYMVDAVIPGIALEYFNKEIMPPLYNFDSRFMTAWIFGAWFGIGGNILVMTGAMSQVPVSCVEAAHIDGCSATREFFAITFPLIYPTWVTLFIVGLVGMFTGGPDLYLFFGETSDSVQTLGYYINVKTLTSIAYASYPEVSAIGLCVTLITTPILIFVRWFLNRLDPNQEN